MDVGLGTASLLDCTVTDIRFPFPVLGSGSDASNAHTVYSNPYVVLRDSDGREGIGISFTLGKGNEHVCSAVEEIFPLIQGCRLADVVHDFRHFWRRLANPSQSRWLGPYCGSHYMAAGAIANAVFDLAAKRAGMPLWQLLSGLSPEETVRLIDFRYVSHLLDEHEAKGILASLVDSRMTRESQLRESGMPCYFTTWIGTEPAALVEQVANVIATKGISHFKVKVGLDVGSDAARLAALRREFGDSIELYIDANQVWAPQQAVEWVGQLAEFGVRWIEEPTAPDSIDGHRFIRERLQRLGIDVVTGENCQNSHMAAQFLAAGAVDRFQIDACRVLGPAENILIMLLAKKFGVPICPHAGGSGLDELVPHLQAWNHIVLNGGSDKTITEHVALCSHHFRNPSEVRQGRLQLPVAPGYLSGLKAEAIQIHRFPDGDAWSG